MCPRRPRGRRFHNAAYIPGAATDEIQTRRAIARACLQFSIFLSRNFRPSGFLGPTICSGIRQTNLIKNAPHDSIDNYRYRFRTAVERWNRWENNGSRFEQSDHVARSEERRVGKEGRSRWS